MNDLINNTIQQITDIAGGFSGVETVIYRNGNLVRRSATGVETVISLDFTETDPTVPGHVKAITSTQVSNWDTAFGWGNHASAGYLTSATLQQVTTAGSVTTNSITVGGLTSTGTILAPQSTSVYALASATTPSLGLKFYASSLMIFMAGGQDTVKIGTGYFASNAPLTFGSQASAPYINYSGNNLFINAGTLTTTGYTSIQTGNLLVGTTTNAGYKLDVNGSARATSVYTADIYPITSSVNLWVNSLNAASRFYTSPVHQDGRINFNAVAGSSDQVLLRAWHTGQFGLGTGSSSAGAALTVRGDSLLVGTSGSLYFMAGTFGPVNVPYRLGITTDATTTYFSTGVGNNLTNIESHAFAFTAKSHTFYTGTTAGNQGNPNQYTPLHLSTLGNVVVGSTTDAGYKLDVNGTARVQGKLTISTGGTEITGTIVGYSGLQVYGTTQIFSGNPFQIFNAANNSKASFQYINASGLALTINSDAVAGVLKGVTLNPTLVAAANNDVLVGLDINPTFTNGAFTGVNNYNIRTGGLITKQYFQSPTTNQGSHTIAFGFGGAGEQVKLIASAAGSTGRGNLYIATATGDAAVATTADANALFATGGNTFYKPFTIEQSTLTTGNGLVLSGNQPNGITNGIYFRFSETRVAILSKPHGATGYADFRIAIVPLGSATPNNPPQESDTKFMITKDTTNVLINTTTDAGYKFDVNGTARTSQLHTFSQGTNLDALTANYFYTADTGTGTYGGLSLKNSINNYNGIIYTGRSGANNTIVFEHTTYAGTATSNGSQKFGLTSTTFGVGANGTYGHTLTIHQRLGGAASYPLIITNLINTTNSGVGIIMQTADSTASGNINHASIVAFKQNLTAPNITSDLRFSTISDAANTLSEKMRISSTGNILIGTTTDAGYRLDVNGNARVQNSLYLSTSGSYLYADTNNIRLIDKNSRIILQSFPEGVASSETYLQSSSGSKFLRIREDYMGLEWCNSNVSNGTENPIRVVRGFFGNVTATNKSVLLVQSTSFSNLANATTLRGIYIDINDTTTYTGFATVRAIEAPRGGAYFNTTSPDASAVLQADSTTQGFLPPRMTTAQRLAITGPATSLIVFDTTADKLFIKTTAGWEMIQSVLETLT